MNMKHLTPVLLLGLMLSVCEEKISTANYFSVAIEKLAQVFVIQAAQAETTVLPESTETEIPKFKDYPAETPYTGENHPLVLDEFATQRKTKFSEVIKNSPANFAGHYIVTSWSCGTDCNMGAVIDAKTGRAYELPVALSSVFPLKPEFDDKGQEHIYRLDSRLMIFAGNLQGMEKSDGKDTIAFYEFKDGKFELLKAKPYGRQEKQDTDKLKQKLLATTPVEKTETKIPKFKDYPAEEIYTGKNHPLVLDDFGKQFKTRLSDAIKNDKPTFSGHYLVTIWGCGSSGCNTGAVIDAITGRAYELPVALSSVFPLKPEFDDKGQEHIYRLNSRLMIFAGNIESDDFLDDGSEQGNGQDTIAFYEFKDGEFKLLKTMPYGRKKTE